MISFKQFLNEAQWMYHGSIHPNLDKIGLRKPSVDITTQGLLDRQIGIHFAADPSISHLFAKGLYTGEEKNGVVYRTKAPSRSKLFRVEQKPIKHGGRKTDQYAIATHIAHTVFSQPENKKMFKAYVKNSRAVDDNEAERIYQHLIQNKPLDASFKHNKMRGTGMKRFIDNFGGLNFSPYKGYHEEMIEKYHDIMKKRGYVGLVYDNSSPEETKHLPRDYGFSPKKRLPGQRGSTKSYIIFEPEKLKIEKV